MDAKEINKNYEFVNSINIDNELVSNKTFQFLMEGFSVLLINDKENLSQKTAKVLKKKKEQCL
jgi:hypothetical protein